MKGVKPLEDKGLETATSTLYRRLQWLAEIPISEVEDKKSKKGRDDLAPDGFWAQLYTRLYKRSQDCVWSCVLAGYAGFALVFGVAHSIDYWTWSTVLFSGGWERVSFWVLFVGLIAPVVFVLLGRRVATWGEKTAGDCESDLAKHLSDIARAASIPSRNRARSSRIAQDRTDHPYRLGAFAT